MAFANRIRSSLPLVSKLLKSETLSSSGAAAVHRAAALSPAFELSRNFSTASEKKEVKVKVPLALYGGSGNYASALYIAAVKSNSLEKVESEILDFVAAMKKSTTFSQFTNDLSVRADVRKKAIEAISAQAKFSETTKNFLVVCAENGRLKNLDTIAKRFVELTMAHKGVVEVVVTSVIPLAAEEEEEVREIMSERLKNIYDRSMTVKVQQKIDKSILGGIVLEFQQKVIDMSIKTRAREFGRLLEQPFDLHNL